jgi:hypothetical protein
MNLKRLIPPAALAAAIAFSATPAAAAQQDQNRRSHEQAARSGDNRGQGNGSARDNGGRAVERAVPRDNRDNNAAQNNRDNNTRQRDEVRAREADRGRANDNRGDNRGRVYDNRGNENRGRVYDNRGYDNRGRVYDNRGYDSRRYAPYVRIVPRYERIAPYRIYSPRPYRSGFNLGIGIFFGNPFPYRYGYPMPVYGYPTVAPGVAYGGIVFGMTPSDADIYIDGQFMGNAQDFTSATQPLTLSAGRHRVELQSPGYRPMVFDADVLPGQVTPFEGGLEPGY